MSNNFTTFYIDSIESDSEEDYYIVSLYNNITNTIKYIHVDLPLIDSIFLNNEKELGYITTKVNGLNNGIKLGILLSIDNDYLLTNKNKRILLTINELSNNLIKIINDNKLIEEYKKLIDKDKYKSSMIDFDDIIKELDNIIRI